MWVFKGSFKNIDLKFEYRSDLPGEKCTSLNKNIFVCDLFDIIIKLNNSLICELSGIFSSYVMHFMNIYEDLSKIQQFDFVKNINEKIIWNDYIIYCFYEEEIYVNFEYIRNLKEHYLIIKHNKLCHMFVDFNKYKENKDVFCKELFKMFDYINSMVYHKLLKINFHYFPHIANLLKTNKKFPLYNSINSKFEEYKRKDEHFMTSLTTSDNQEKTIGKLFFKELHNLVKKEYIKSLSYLIVFKIKKDKKLNKLFDINIFKHILTKYLF